MADHSPISWEDFDKIHVIKRLRELVGRWWNIQINFTDSKGLLRGVAEGKFFNPLNEICQAVTADQHGFSSCRGTASQTTIDCVHSKTERLSRCHAGFSTLSVPIRINNKFMGAVFGDGFVLSETADEQKALIKSYLESSFRGDSKSLISYVEKLPVLTSKDVSYLKELINLVVEEILVMHKHLHEQKAKVDQLSGQLGTRYGFDQMIGKSSPMQSLYRLLERVCESDSTILVQGENGTGKELIARAIHYNSGRKKNKFLIVNCGAFNENLLESELFGHVKGAFTGAMKDKKGLFEAADGGTLFLDEIGETSMSMQVKLLRVLQEGTFNPVGSTQGRKTSVRILAATNRDLTQMVQEKNFREDLFYRLNVINVVVPPLRERKEDIPLLVNHFLAKFAEEMKKEEKTIVKECMNLLLDHSWPGNVRELENEIERLCVLSGNTKELTQDLLSAQVQASSKASFPGLRINGRLKDSIEELERQMIMEGLERTNWNKSKLAKELGISRAGLIMKVEKYGLEKRAGNRVS
jgi:two-component system, NtrC family, response regulator HupR/HoxA